MANGAMDKSSEGCEERVREVRNKQVDVDVVDVAGGFAASDVFDPPPFPGSGAKSLCFSVNWFVSPPIKGLLFYACDATRRD